MVHAIGTSLIDNKEKEKKEPTTITGSEAKTYTLEIENGKLKETIGYEDKDNQTIIIATPPHSTMFDFVQEHQPYNPILDQPLVHNNPNFSYDSTLGQQLDQIANLACQPFYYEHDDIYGSEKDTYKERKCWVCGKTIYFNECLSAELNKYYFIAHRSHDVNRKANIEAKVREQLEKQWESDKIEIPCCNCFEILKTLQTRNLRTIQYHTDNYKIYDVKGKTFRKNKSKNTSVQLIFGDYNINITIKAFKNLVEKGFIDIDPLALRELLGGSD